MTDSKPAKAPASKAPASKAPAAKNPATKTPAAKAPAAKAPAAKAAAATPAVVTPPPPAPPAPPAPQYAQQNPYGNAGAVPQYGPKTNVLAIVSLVTSLAGLLVPFLAPVAGIIMGHIALSQIKRTGETGRGLAVAGTVIGYVLAALAVLGLIAYIIFFAVLFSSGVLEPGVVI